MPLPFEFHMQLWMNTQSHETYPASFSRVCSRCYGANIISLAVLECASMLANRAGTLTHMLPPSLGMGRCAHGVKESRRSRLAHDPATESRSGGVNESRSQGVEESGSQGMTESRRRGRVEESRSQGEPGGSVSSSSSTSKAT